MSVVFQVAAKYKTPTPPQKLSAKRMSWSLTWVKFQQKKGNCKIGHRPREYVFWRGSFLELFFKRLIKRTPIELIQYRSVWIRIFRTKLRWAPSKLQMMIQSRTCWRQNHAEGSCCAHKGKAGKDIICRGVQWICTSDFCTLPCHQHQQAPMRVTQSLLSQWSVRTLSFEINFAHPQSDESI